MTDAISPGGQAGSLHGRGQGSSPYLLVPISLLFILLILAVLRAPNLISSAGIGSAIIVATPLILATYALMATVMAGRGTVDLAVGPLIGFVNVTLIQLVGAGYLESPLATFAYVLAVGMAYQLLMALIIIFVRVQPIIVSLSGYLALTGINLVILPRPGGAAPEWMSSWGLGTTIFSPILAILVVATLAWLLFTRTAFFTHLRLMGSDERAAYTSGIPIIWVRIGTHLISGCYSGLAALCFTALIGSGDPSQGTTYTLISVTALVLGGASLAGGRGGVMGSLFGALNLYLIAYVLATFNFGAIQSFVTDLAYGVILVGSLLLTLALPFIQRHVRNFSPLLYFVVLSVATFGVILHMTFGNAVPSLPQGAASGFLEMAILGGDTAPASQFSHLWTFAGLLLIILPLLLRALVSRSGRSDIGPLVYLVLAGLVLLVAYFLTRGQAHGAMALIEVGR
jgi:ribose transport system permease protein